MVAKDEAINFNSVTSGKINDAAAQKSKVTHIAQARMVYHQPNCTIIQLFFIKRQYIKLLEFREVIAHHAKQTQPTLHKSNVNTHHISPRNNPNIVKLSIVKNIAGAHSNSILEK